MKRCVGKGRPMGAPEGTLRQCPYETLPGSEYCYFHDKVVKGQIRDLGGGGAKRPPPPVSWSPTKQPPDLQERVSTHDTFQQLLEEFG